MITSTQRKDLIQRKRIFNETMRKKEINPSQTVNNDSGGNTATSSKRF
jgi:hypothetical protein